MNKKKTFNILFFTLFFVFNIVFLSSNIKFNSNILESFNKAGQDSFLKMGGIYESNKSRDVNISIKASSDQMRAKYAKVVEKSLRDSNLFTRVESEVGPSLGLELPKYISKNMRFLLSNQQIQKLKNKEFDFFVSEALVKLYSPFYSGSLLLERDPLFLIDSFMSRLANPTSITLRNNLFVSSKYNDVQLIFAKIQKNKEEQALNLIQSLKSKLVKAGVELSALSASFYGVFAKKTAVNESTLFFIISIVLVLVLFYIFFKSFKQLVLGIIIIVSSLLFGLVVTTMVYGKIHVISFLMGGSVVGIVADYIIHFFNKEADNNIKSGSSAFKNIKKPLLYGYFTSSLGISLFFLSDIILLKQFSVFSLASLALAYMLVSTVLPFFFTNMQSYITESGPMLNERICRNINRPFSWPLLIIFLLGNILLISKYIYKNDNVRNFSKSDNYLKRDERKIKKYIDLESEFEYFVVRGKSKEELLENEEYLVDSLDKQGIKFSATSQFVPSRNKQKRSQKYYKYLDIPISKFYQEIGHITENRHFIENKSMFVILSEWMKKFSGHYVNELWPGETDGLFYSIVPIYRDLNKMASFAPLETKDIFFYSKIEKINNSFTELKKLIARLLLVIAIVLILLLAIKYSFQSAFLVVVPALFSTSLALLVISTLIGSLNVFHVLGALLAFTLGLDYSFFYFFKNKEDNLIGRGVFLSCLTTLFTFGLLAFSETEGVSSFGGVVALGVFMSWFFSPLSIYGSIRREKA